MFRDSNSIEVSTQQLRFDENLSDADAALHLPLTDLSSAAPNVNTHIYRSDEVGYPFSNDDCTEDYFEQLAIRTETSEYKNAQNRVAILIGESGLLANIKHIPEETIILLDDSKDMNIFMDEYVSSLRNSSGPRGWLETLATIGPSDTLDYIGSQVDIWHKHGRTHPLRDDEAFYEAQRIARQKVIVTWNADITNSATMVRLGQALAERQAEVTMMNLSNVLPYAKTFRHPTECAANLHPLPITPNAPILTTSIGSRPKDLVEAIQGLWGNFVTGPFYGLDNLARAAFPDGKHELGALVERNVISSETGTTLTEEDIILNVLESILPEASKGRLKGDSAIVIGIDSSFLSSLIIEKPEHKRFWRRKK